MKARYKLLLVILLLWLGMSYEGSRNATPAPVNRQHSTLDERIDAYERELMGETFSDEQDRSSSNHSHQGNLVARTGRNIGQALQNAVREMLRGIVRFFDGVIS